MKKYNLLKLRWFSNLTFQNALKSLMILIVGIGLTVVSTLYMKHEEETEINRAFKSLCGDLKAKIYARLQIHAQLLRSGSAFFAASDTVTRSEWHEFNKRAKIDENLPGIQGVGFSLLIPKNQLRQHILNIRKEGFSDYTVKPAGDRAIYSSIIYLEPFAGRNLRAFGYDMLSEPIRRKATEMSRDSDVAMISGKVILVQETNQDVQTGTLMYVPVYRNGMPVSTVEQRRAAIKGWVYSPYRMNDLMLGILGSGDVDRLGRIRLQIYDECKSLNSLLFDSQRNDTLNHPVIVNQTVSLPIDFNGKKWILCFTKSGGQSPLFLSKVFIVFIGGVIISLLLFSLLLSFFNTQFRAQIIAEQLTSKLKESEEKHRLLIENSHDIIYTLTADGVFNFVSSAWTAILGHPISQVSGQPFRQFVHPEDLSGCFAFLQKVITSGQRQKGVEYRMLHTDGTWYWHTSSAVALRDQTGAIIGIEGIARDISDRKRTEDLLQQTRQNYETFFNTIDEFLFVLDEQGNIIHANSTVIDRLGYTEDEFFGKSVFMFYPAERREEAGRIVDKMLNGSAEFCQEPIITKSGIHIPVETRVSHGFWDGRPAIFGVTKDISQLRLSEEKFSKLFHLNPSACGLSDLDSRKYIEVNEVFCSLFGFGKQEVIGKTPVDLGMMTPETINALLSTADGNGAVTNAEAELTAKNGDIRHVLLSAENIYVQDKRYRFTVVHDITELKSSKVLLEKTTARLSLATRAGGVGVWDYDVVNNILLWDDQMFSLYGIKKNDFIGVFEAWRSGVHPDDMERGDAEIQMAMLGEKEFDTEFRVLWPDGNIRNLRALAIVQRDNEGKPLHMIGTNWDITDQKAFEYALLVNEKNLQNINAEKDKFFSIIAHDLRGPFNLFLGFTKMLAEEIDSFSPHELQKIVLSMRNSATNLYNLLENLLEWSRSQRGLIKFEPESFLLLALVSESMRPVMDSANKKGIGISIEIPDDQKVFADEYMLASIIRNLASNAVKFSRKGGAVIIAAKPASTNSVEISVRDSGIGMSAALADDLFRLDVQTTRKGTDGEPSTGLGLLLCKDFIEKHGGKLWVESEEGKGSTFSFTLPKK